MTEIKATKLSGFKACIGLLGAKKPYGVFFNTRFGIHTFFMKFPIDVLVLDKEHKAVMLKKSLKPYRIFLWNPKFDKVLELPEGTIATYKIRKGVVTKLEIEA